MNARSHQSGLFRHSLLLLFVTQIGGVANLVFQMVMMRQLSTVEYGVLATMLSLVHVFSVPLEALRTTVAHQAGLLSQMNAPGNVRPLAQRWIHYLLIPSALVLLAGWSGGTLLADFFQLPSPSPIFATAVIVASLPHMLVYAGALQGLQAFAWMAAVREGWGLVRLIVGAALVALVAPVATAGLSAHALGLGVTILIGLIVLRCLSRNVPTKDSVIHGHRNYFLMSVLILGAYAVISHADVMLVKRFFAPEDAGLFAKAATMGRTIIFITVPVSMAMFPKVISTGLTTHTDRRVVLRALLLAGLLIATTALAVHLLARYIWVVFTGAWPDDAVVHLVRIVVWAMAPLGITLLLVNFELAQRRFRIAAILPGLAVLYIMGVTFWHNSLEQVVAVMSVISVSSLVLLSAHLLHRGLIWEART